MDESTKMIIIYQCEMFKKRKEEKQVNQYYKEKESARFKNCVKYGM